MKIITINDKQYRVQTNGLVHVLESNRGNGWDWRVLNRKTRGKEYREAIRQAAN